MDSVEKYNFHLTLLPFTNLKYKTNFKIHIVFLKKNNSRLKFVYIYPII